MGGQRLAAKVLLPEHAASAQARARMSAEASVHEHAGRHPHLVRAHDFLETSDGRTFIVLDLLHGNTLHDEVAERGALPVAEALAWVRRGLSGLGALHALFVVHRDVKPANLFVCRQKGRPVEVRLIDYGYAKPFHADSPIARVTPSTADFVGTHRYSAPEQADARTAKFVDQRADLYSMALVLYALLRGKEPYAHLRPGKQLLAAQVEQTVEPPSPPTIERLSSALWEVLRVPLAKDRDQRFSSTTEFIEALDSIESSRARERDSGVSDVDDLPLTAKQHAQMTAELELYPDASAEVRARFGVSDDAAWLRAQRRWDLVIGRHSRLRRKWEEHVRQHRAYLLEAAAGESA